MVWQLCGQVDRVEIFPNYNQCEDMIISRGQQLWGLLEHPKELLTADSILSILTCDDAIIDFTMTIIDSQMKIIGHHDFVLC